MALVLVVCVFFMDTEWKTVLKLVLAMRMFQSQADYIYCLYLLHLLLFIADEKYVHRGNVLPFGVMLLFTIPILLFHASKESSSTVRNLLFQVLLIVLLGWCVLQALRPARNYMAGHHLKLRISFDRWEAIITVMVAVFPIVGNGVG